MPRKVGAETVLMPPWSGVVSIENHGLATNSGFSPSFEAILTGQVILRYRISGGCTLLQRTGNDMR